ncbi:putative tetratricopeptide-like helical domain superfamily [Helianthus annuus]|nr:putative tetratricopeptide-like helical domain superfamily [Helianthus annuus]KAJ0921042.1 putative tetratricopeptide-like helical domain superfamily [Helianthus annuus]KAJ0921046.1 putative tetratricopeptide-like helical domain superfamily [Helianthus annuus]
MFLKLFSTKRSHLFARGSIHLGKHFKYPNPEDIAFTSISLHLRQRKWNLLDKLLSSNLTNTLVNRLLIEFRRSPELALGFYKRVVGEQKSFSPSLDNVCILIHVMISCKRYDDALDLMSNLMQTMGYSHLEVLEGLWNSYDAEISCPDVFDALVRAASTLLGDAGCAYQVIMKLRMEKDFDVSIHAWNNFLNCVIRSDDMNRFWRKYEEMIGYGYVENVYTMNLVIHALCKEMLLYEVLSVFYRMLKGGIYPNVVSFNMIINGACKTGDVDLGLKLFRKMEMLSRGFVMPNLITFNCLINGYCKLGDMNTAESLGDEMKKMGIKPNLRTYGTLVDGYLRKGCTDEAFRLCSHMVDKGLIPNNVIYNSIIHWLYFGGDSFTASSLLSHMIKTNVCFDKFTNAILVKGLSRNGFLNEALGYHEWLVGKNLVDKDLFLENILVYYLFRSGNESVSKVKQILNDIVDRGLTPDTVTYGTMIDAFSKQGSISNAVRVYDDMIKMGKRPNLVIYNSIVDGLSKNVSVDVAKIMVDELKKLSLLDVVTVNILLNGYCANWKVKEALSLFFQMQEDGKLVNEVTYNILINFVCKFGSIQEARELMEMMVTQGLTPDSITYTILVTHACKKISPEELIELHDNLVVKGVIPDSQTYNTIVAPLIGKDRVDL